MYQTTRTYVRAGLKMIDLIMENPMLLLMLEHFGFDGTLQEKTVDMICKELDIDLSLFLQICNLYNGFTPEPTYTIRREDIACIIHFLKNSHHFYKQEKYPEIRAYITHLQHFGQKDEISLIEQFFDNYFMEVLEHLDYEDQVAFPYFNTLAIPGAKRLSNTFSAKEYSDHHSDIETKLSDLKNLLMKHVHVENNMALKRKLIFSLLELEHDLTIHSAIEEHMLVPVIERLEQDGIHE